VIQSITIKQLIYGQLMTLNLQKIFLVIEKKNKMNFLRLKANFSFSGTHALPNDAKKTEK
jgi:hypothetical protein